MLEPWDWTEQDLLQLIVDQVGESLTLDYKESGALQRTDGKKNELSKDVSAFANAAGGVLVYGMREDGHVPIELDGGLDPNEISKEWVEQVINSRIARRITGLRVRQVPLSGPRSGRVAYVIHVPSSAHAPHMAAGHRYYKRFNFESVPMEDYEVRDVSRRFVAPELNLGLLSQKTASAVQHKFSVYVENLSSAQADYALITFHVTTSGNVLLDFLNVSGIPKVADNAVVHDGITVDVHSYKLEWRGSLRLPLMHGTKCHVAELTLSTAGVVAIGHIFWEVFAPGAEVRRGTYLLRQQGGSLIIEPSKTEWHLADAPVWRI